MYPARGVRRAVSTALKSHLRDLVDDAFFAVVETVEIGRAEAERAGEKHRREGLDSGVVARHRGVERAARGGELVLDVGQLALQLLEVGAGLEVGIGLAKREQLVERDAQLRLVARVDATLRGAVARLDHRVERL